MDPDVSSPRRLVRLLKERHRGFQMYMQRLIAKVGWVAEAGRVRPAGGRESSALGSDRLSFSAV